MQCHLKNGLTGTENKTVPDTEADSCDLPRYPCNAVSSPRDLGTGESPAEVLVEKIRSKLAQRSSDQSILRKRLPQVIRVNRESIVEHWLGQLSRILRSVPFPSLIPNTTSMCLSYWMWQRALRLVRSSPLRTGKFMYDMERAVTDKAIRFRCSFGKRVITSFPRRLHPAQLYRDRDELFGTRYDSFYGNN